MDNVFEEDYTDYWGCLSCSHAWPMELDDQGDECPQCGSDNVVDIAGDGS